MPSPETPHEPGGGELVPVKFSRLTRRGILLGLSLPQLIVLGIAILTVVASLYTAGGMGLAWTSRSGPAPPSSP